MELRKLREQVMMLEQYGVPETELKRLWGKIEHAIHMRMDLQKNIWSEFEDEDFYSEYGIT